MSVLLVKRILIAFDSIAVIGLSEIILDMLDKTYYQHNKRQRDDPTSVSQVLIRSYSARLLPHLPSDTKFLQVLDFAIYESAKEGSRKGFSQKFSQKNYTQQAKLYLQALITCKKVSFIQKGNDEITFGTLQV